MIKIHITKIFTVGKAHVIPGYPLYVLVACAYSNQHHPHGLNWSKIRTSDSLK